MTDPGRPMSVYKKVWVCYSDLSNVVVGCAWQQICQVSPWLLLKIDIRACFDLNYILCLRELLGSIELTDTYSFRLNAG